MARITDQSKIERIKDATMQLVVEKGYGNASISQIAKIAQVAEGYLYGYYKSKYDLVQDLLFINMNELVDEIEQSLSNGSNIFYSIEQFIRKLFELANNQPDRIKFLYVLLSDYNFKLQENQIQRIFNICKRVKESGQKSGILRNDINEEDIYIITVSYPIQFINLRIKSFFYKSELGESEIVKVLNNCKLLIKK